MNNSKQNRSIPSVHKSVGLSSVPYAVSDIFKATGNKQQKGYKHTPTEFKKIATTLNIVNNPKNRARCKKACTDFIKASASNVLIHLDVEDEQLHTIYPQDTPKRVTLKRSYLNNCPQVTTLVIFGLYPGPGVYSNDPEHVPYNLHGNVHQKFPFFHEEAYKVYTAR